MIKPKAVVVDLDGTLLNSQKTVSERSRNSLIKLKKEGIAVIVATARPPRLVNTISDFFKEVDYFVYYNGAMTIDRIHRTERHNTIPAASTYEIYRYIMSNDPHHFATFEVDDAWCASRELSMDEMECFRVGREINLPQIVSEREIAALTPHKILFTNKAGSQQFEERFHNRVHITYSQAGELTEVMNDNVSKEAGVSDILKTLSIGLDETAAFGDDYNDLGLFRVCGITVAMANAVEELKAAARFTTGTNDEDGVADILEQWFF